MKTFITRAYSATKLLLKANAPTLMVTGGVVAMGTGTVLACRQTLQVESILAPHVASLEEITKGVELELPSYGSDSARSDRFKVYSRVTVDLTKLYFVPGTLFLGGTVLVFGGHRIMLKRNATLAMAFTTLSKAFDAYRERVVDAFGSETDQAMMNGWVSSDVVDENGEIFGVNTRDWDAVGDPYNRVFGEYESSEWVDDLGLNKMHIANIQRMANERLGRQGYLYLNDVYKSLGFKENDIGQVVGWKVKYLPDGSRDIPFVDFGLDKPHPDDWKFSREKAIYLDFNCSGLIVGGRVQKALERA